MAVKLLHVDIHILRRALLYGNHIVTCSYTSRPSRFPMRENVLACTSPVSAKQWPTIQTGIRCMQSNDPAQQWINRERCIVWVKCIGSIYENHTGLVTLYFTHVVMCSASVMLHDNVANRWNDGSRRSTCVSMRSFASLFRNFQLPQIQKSISNLELRSVRLNLRQVSKSAVYSGPNQS